MTSSSQQQWHSTGRRRQRRKRRSAVPKVFAIVFGASLLIGIVATMIIFAIKATDSAFKPKGDSQQSNKTSSPLEKKLIGRWEGVLILDEKEMIDDLNRRGASPRRAAEIIRKWKSAKVTCWFRENGTAMSRVLANGKPMLPNGDGP